jgi:hypothetical protein
VLGRFAISADPFSAPTDRDMLPSERRTLVRTHRTCVFGYAIAARAALHHATS